MTQLISGRTGVQLGALIYSFRQIHNEGLSRNGAVALERQGQVVMSWHQRPPGHT